MKKVSVASCVPILPWIRSRHIAVRQLDDRLTTAEWITVRSAYLVPHRAQRSPNALRYRRFERDVCPLHVAEARCIDRLLHVHSEDEKIEQHLDMSLRLHGAAHHPKAHPRRVAAAVGLWIGGGLRHKTGNERVKRTLPRRDRIR